MINYPPLPFPPYRRPGDESRHAYGVRLLIWLLDSNVTATLSDDQLDLAHHTVAYALTARNVIKTGETSEDTPAAVYDRLECLRRLLSQIIKARVAEMPTASTAQEPAWTSPAPPGRTNGTRLVPLEPAPISRPLAGQRVDIRF